MPDALFINGLVKRYRSGPPHDSRVVHALAGVSMSVRRGEIVGLTGARGSGKSTLLLCAAGLVRADAGIVTWFDSRLQPPSIPPGIAFAPQRTSYYSFLTVREALEYYATLHDLGTSDRASQVDRVVREVALTEHATRRVSCRAPPLWQRLSLAQALIGAPRALLLDETLSGDLPTCLDIRRVLRKLAHCGVSILVAAEEPARLASIADRVVRLSAGRVVSKMETAGFASPPSHQRRPLLVS